MKRKPNYKQRSGKTSKQKFEKNNFQDQAMKREYTKGERAGASQEKFATGGNNLMDKYQNDPQWYYKQDQILRDVSSYSFNQPVGTRLRPEQLVDANWSSWGQAVSGVFGVGVALTPGLSTDLQSPINLAALNAYSFVRYKNSGSRNYDSPDLMMYLLTMDSIYACWNWLKRIYGYASTYSQMNRYMPRAYALLDHVDLKDVVDNLANFRGYLNMAANRISAFCVPATMSYNVRHSWLFSNIYKDADISKAQQYMFVPSYFYQYQETTSDKGGILQPIKVTYGSAYDAEDTSKPTWYTVEDLKSLLDSLINNALLSEDIGVMSGDILKAYGDSGLYKLSLIPDDYKVQPVYNAEVLMQIENAVIGHSPSQLPDISEYSVTQDPDTNAIIFDPVLVGTASPTKGRILNFHHENPTPSDVIVASRLMRSEQLVTQGDTTTLHYQTVGSEISLQMWIVTNCMGSTPIVFDTISKSGTPTLSMRKIPFTNIGFSVSASDQDNMIGLTSLWMWSAFDWAPYFLMTYAGKDGNWAIPWMMDYGTYTTLSLSDIDALNLLALVSEFNIPN